MTSKTRFLAALLASGALANLVACSSEAFAPVNDLADAMVDAHADIAPDTAPDGGALPPDADEVDAAPDSHALPEASSDAAPDSARDTAQDRAPDAVMTPDARDAQTDATAADALAEASVDAPPIGSDAAPDVVGVDGPSRTCIFQSSGGPIECHAASPGGRTYCNASSVCTMCESLTWLNCDGNDDNGCEVVMSDENCGSCGVKCNAIQYCNLNVGGGTCQKKPDAG